MPAQSHPAPAARRDGLAQMEGRLDGKEKVGPAEGFLLAVVALIGGVIVVGGLVLSVVSIAVGDGIVPGLSHSE